MHPTFNSCLPADFSEFPVSRRWAGSIDTMKSNMKNRIGLFFLVLALSATGCTKQPVVNPDNGSFGDSRDMHVYNWARIGQQVWMAENLAFLPSVSPLINFSETEPIYYIYGYNGSLVSEAKAASNYTRYGVLYNWQAAIAACPAGWHLPGDDEWKLLETYLGMSQQDLGNEGFRASGSVGNKLKVALMPPGRLPVFQRQL